MHPAHVSRAQKRDDISALKFGIIYGANASGKSNVIKAIALLQQIALGRFPIGDFEPFKLVKPIKPVSKIEIEFKTDGRYFAYGVEFSALAKKPMRLPSNSFMVIGLNMPLRAEWLRS